MNDTIKFPAFRFFLAIVNREHSKEASNLFASMHMHLLYQCYAQGTAKSETLDILGLSNNDKIIYLCIAPKPVADELLEAISDELSMKKKGRGIALTLPVSGLSNPILKILSEESREKLISQMESDVNTMKHESTHVLVVSVINQGYSEELMEVAKTAGATGGTIVPARRSGGAEPAKFWGICVQEEKEIVAIVTPQDKKMEIMKAISHDFGITTKAQGMVFSLPVDHIVGV